MALLVENKADVNARNYDDKTPCDWVQEKGKIHKSDHITQSAHKNL